MNNVSVSPADLDDFEAYGRRFGVAPAEMWRREQGAEYFLWSSWASGGMAPALAKRNTDAPRGMWLRRADMAV